MHLNPSGQRGLSAYAVYLILSGGRSLFFTLIFTVNMIYFVTTLKLDPLQLVLVGTTLEASAFLFEVPTGVVADVYSRRLSIIIGMLLMGAAFILQGAVPTYAAVLLAQVGWGIGYTFTSGATEAWIVDEIGEERAGQAFMRASQANYVGGILGTIASVGLAALLRIEVPMILGGVLFLGLGVFLILYMPETGFKRATEGDRRSWSAMFGTFREGVQLVRMKPVLISILAITVVYGVASEGFDRLWHKHVIDTITLPGLFEPVIWFGIIGVISKIIGLGVNEFIRRRLDFNSPVAVARASMILNLMIAGGILALALTGNLAVAFVALWFIGPLRGASDPVYSAWINQSLDPRVRATVLSMSSQVNALGQVAGGPVVGLIGNLASVRAALAVSALIWAAATPLYRRSVREPITVPEAGISN
ncbi:MAG: MFS transporter [Anaerolineae bacterium]|nr:MFS transporter [Anaerolineae bacterium]